MFVLTDLSKLKYIDKGLVFLVFDLLHTLGKYQINVEDIFFYFSIIWILAIIRASIRTAISNKLSMNVKIMQ